MDQKINKKLLNLFKRLSEEELIEFRKFVASPIYSSGRNYLPIVDGIIRYLNDLNKNRKMKTSYFPPENSRQTIKNRQSELFGIGEEFLIYRRIELNRTEKDKLLLRSLSERGFESTFNNRLVQSLAYLESLPNDEDKFSDIVEFQKIELQHLIKINDFNKYFPVYFDSSFYFTCLTFIQMYDFGIEFRQQNLLNKKFEFNLVTNILRNLEFDMLPIESNYRKLMIYQIVILFYNIYKSFENFENEENYFQARKIFSKIKVDLSDELKLRVYKYLIYYSANRQNMGEKKFQQELFLLFNEKLKSGFVSDFSENIYPLNNFRDYVFIGIEVNQLEWVRNFIRDYSKYLPEHLRDNEVRISYSKVFFESGEFDKSLEYLENVKPSNFLHYFDTSVTRLCCYYEIGNSEDALSEIDKLRHYIRGHLEVPKIHKIYTSNFTKIYGKLLKARLDPDFEDIEQLNDEILRNSQVSKRKWLIKKITEFRNQKYSSGKKYRASV